MGEAKAEKAVGGRVDVPATRLPVNSRAKQHPYSVGSADPRRDGCSFVSDLESPGKQTTRPTHHHGSSRLVASSDPPLPGLLKRPPQSTVPLQWRDETEAVGWLSSEPPGLRVPVGLQEQGRVWWGCPDLGILDSRSLPLHCGLSERTRQNHLAFVPETLLWVVVLKPSLAPVWHGS